MCTGFIPNSKQISLTNVSYHSTSFPSTFSATPPLSCPSTLSFSFLKIKKLEKSVVQSLTFQNMWFGEVQKFELLFYRNHQLFLNKCYAPFSLYGNQQSRILSVFKIMKWWQNRKKINTYICNISNLPPFWKSRYYKQNHLPKNV